MLASAFGALYACFALVFGVRGVWSILADLAICLIMCAIAYYRPKEARAVAIDALVYSAVSILLGGAMTALFYFFNRIGLDRLLGSEEDADGVSVWLFALIAIAGAIGTAFGGRLMRKRATRRACRVSITLGGRTIALDGIFDSGNLLCEPISALPCIIIEEKTLASLVGKEVARSIASGCTDRLREDILRRLRAVPMRTVSGESICYAIRPDELQIVVGKETRSVEAYIALSHESIRAEGAEALVPSRLCC
jgi:sigma-E processing peptidase SpoIIGA